MPSTKTRWKTELDINELTYKSSDGRLYQDYEYKQFSGYYWKGQENSDGDINSSRHAWCPLISSNCMLSSGSSDPRWGGETYEFAFGANRYLRNEINSPKGPDLEITNNSGNKVSIANQTDFTAGQSKTFIHCMWYLHDSIEKYFLTS